MTPPSLILLLSLVSPWLLAPSFAHLTTNHHVSYDERLIFRPLADGKISILFNFHIRASNVTAHHSVTPPTLILPLQRNGVSELHLSFVAGRWQHERWGQPIHPEVGGTGAEMRAWIRGSQPEENWTAVTNALAGIFCSSLGQISPAITSSPSDIFPRGHANQQQGSFLHVQLPSETLCTENLTPFLKLVPCKGVSGISGLMKPYILLAHDWHAMGIDYTSNEDDSDTDLLLWWEAVIDPIDWEKHTSRDFSIVSLFDRNLPRACSVADVSEFILSGSEDDLAHLVTSPSSSSSGDGFRLWKYDNDLSHKNIDFRWINESAFVPPLEIAAPPISFSRILTGTGQLEGGLESMIRNNQDIVRTVKYVEILPWWIQPWLHRLHIEADGMPAEHCLVGKKFIPSVGRTRPTTLELTITIQPQTTISINLPFNKAFIRYTEHPPDASRGFDLPPAILYLQDLADPSVEETLRRLPNANSWQQRQKLRIYSSKLLLDLATPDFSMPYNVIIMTSTLLALFFGSVFNALSRRFGVVQVDPLPKKA
ncbi:hypothetical protein QFC21_002778 [Naganishia friedmannii]|uniref:Uncharacterized protein n=1 Tax=Naganishia friedmannii TaxID=89922 RepID=A0ACC2VTD0_9TREE|nr:hypothetical protein QFC21_002778 [Naganishia friedmannii]